MPDQQITPMSPVRFGSFADTRRWAFFSIGARMLPMDTGRVHGPRPRPSQRCKSMCSGIPAARYHKVGW